MSATGSVLIHSSLYFPIFGLGHVRQIFYDPQSHQFLSFQFPCCSQRPLKIKVYARILITTTPLKLDFKHEHMTVKIT